MAKGSSARSVSEKAFAPAEVGEEPRDNAPTEVMADVARILDLDPEQRAASRVYVSGASLEYQRARKVIDAIGVDRVTLDWPAVLVAQEVPDNGLSIQQCRAFALAEFDAVDRCDILVALLPHPGNESTGLWAELGYAVKAGKVIYTVGVRKGIFWSLRDRHFSDDDKLIKWIRGGQ